MLRIFLKEEGDSNGQGIINTDYLYSSDEEISFDSTNTVSIETSLESPATPSLLQEYFSDVPSHDPDFYKSMKYLKERNIVKGYADGSFEAEKKISRAEFLKILLLSKYS